MAKSQTKRKTTANKSVSAKKAEQQKAYNEALQRQKPFALPKTDKKIVVSIGMMSAVKGRLHAEFSPKLWEEVRVDAYSAVEPDLVSPLHSIKEIKDGEVDAVWIGHMLHRCSFREGALVLAEALRMVKEGGDIVVAVPDLQLACTYVARSEDETKLYDSGAGPVRPVDVIYGFQKFIDQGDMTRLHRSGYTAEMLGRTMRDCAISNITVTRQAVDLLAHGRKLAYNDPNRVDRISIQTSKASRPNAPDAPSPIQAQPSQVRFVDPLEQEPQIWKPLGLKKS